MAAPQLSPYATNGPCRTGRTAANGDYCSGTVRAKAVDSSLCAGWMQYSGIKSFSVIPIFTWAEYPTGISDITMSGGVPTSGVFATSYTEDWHNWTNVLVPPIQDMHPIELRYYCLLYSSATRMIIWFSSGGGYLTYYSPPPPPGPEWLGYYPNPDIDLSATFAMNLDVDCIERVDIEQQENGSSEWVWPTNMACRLL
jgi:hypothetical protein